MKHHLRASIDAALQRLTERGLLPEIAVPTYQIEVPKLAQHGDFSTNVAMLLAKPCRRKPSELAALIVEELQQHASIARCEVAGPGFINLLLTDAALFEVVSTARTAGPAYGRSRHGIGHTVQVEFVSANPTGPLHIGHGRGAAIGSVLAKLLEACGYEVQCEYYVNDAGRQMDILALSVWLRYLEAGGLAVTFPAQAYQGAYVLDIALAVRTAHGAALEMEPGQLAPSPAADTPDRQLDECIEKARALLGSIRYLALREFAKDHILDGIKTDLAAFGTTFDRWYSEASLADNGAIDTALAQLTERGHLFTADGARWFRSSAFGDEKDRVVERENGLKTYFASDIAYHAEKFARGFDEVIDVWGADHHGYIPRIRASLTALGLDPARLDVVLVQFATLLRGGEKVAMSTRSGEFVTLRELVDEVGVDATRFFYVMRRSDQHLEFDLDLATAQNNDNPVYYVQYAHARVCSVFRQLAERGLPRAPAGAALAMRLGLPAERALAMRIAAFGELIVTAATAREPHQLTSYLRELATDFHGYYNGHKFLVDDAELRDARLELLEAVQIVIANGLALLGISAPTAM